jgi:hypothetical protein
MLFLVVGVVLGRGSVQLVHAADFILSGGSDCAAIGIWNAATNTCTLSGNIHGSVEIRGSNITLDGAGRSIVGAGTGVGSGIEVLSFNLLYTNVTIKNVSISGWQNGVNLYRAYTATIASSTIAANNVGIVVGDSPTLTVTDCIYNQPSLQSAHFSAHINCIYHHAQDRIMCT